MLAIALFLLFTPFLWWFFILFKFRLLEKVPGPSRLPILGNVTDVGQTPKDLFENFCKLNKRFDGVFRLHIFNEVRLCIAKPNLVEEILTSTVHLTKSNSYDLLKPLISFGLLTSTGEKWKTRRKMISPTFHFTMLEQFIDVFNSAGNVLIAKLAEELGNECVDIYPYMNLYSVDVICETAMGIKLNVQKGQNSAYTNAVHDFLSIMMIRVFSWRKFTSLFKFSSLYTPYANSLKILHGFTSNVIEKRRKEKSRSKLLHATATEDGIKRKVALLDMLLESEHNNILSNEDLREEINTFMLAGHETISSSLGFIILALADNQLVQGKLYQEVKKLTADDANITMQHLLNAKYVEMVIKEGQRLYPTVPYFERKPEFDFTLGDVKCPKGTIISIFTYGMHHDERNFPNPKKFDPDRFLAENQSQRHAYAYIPFSAGPRNCIGQKFAMLQMKSTIIKIIKNYRILPVRNFKPVLELSASLRSFNGICVKLVKRSQNDK